MERYVARSASDKTDEWPFWFIADRHQGNRNVFAPLMEKAFGVPWTTMPFGPRDFVQKIAALANEMENRETSANVSRVS